MGRMLQALKNLEARSARPSAAKNALSHLAADAAASRAAAPATPPPPAAISTIAAPSAAFDDEPATSLEMLAPSVVVNAPPQSPAPFAPVFLAPAFAGVPAAESAAGFSTPQPASARREPRSAERLVRRALGEPHRRQPIDELASRLRQDAQETGSRTLLFVGLGAESAANEALLHLSALLADEGARVLLIDGDLARQALSLDLESAQQPGLADLATTQPPASGLVQPTCFDGLAFLPAGTARHASLAPAADRLARLLGELAGEYDLLLIDGGRAGETNVATLARAADATYVVVQLGAIEASTAQAALRDLRAAGARLLGCVAIS